MMRDESLAGAQAGCTSPAAVVSPQELTTADYNSLKQALQQPGTGGGWQRMAGPEIQRWTVKKGNQ
jgi:hypothetical protein